MDLKERLEVLHHEYQHLNTELARLQTEMNNVLQERLRCEGAARVLQQMIEAEQSQEEMHEPV